MVDVVERYDACSDVAVNLAGNVNTFCRHMHFSGVLKKATYSYELCR